MMVLVTGANGFVGRSLVAQLTHRGFAVRAVQRCFSLSGKLDEFDKVVVGDIGPDTNWDKALVGVDCVIHLAARVHVMADHAADPLSEFRRVNRDATVRLAEAASRIGVRRFVYLSTIKVNGEKTSCRPFSVTDPSNPLDPYGISKLEAEDGLHRLSGKTGLEIVIIRPPLVYGPGVKANFYKMMQFLAKGIPLPFGAIRNKRSFVALENLLDLVITCIDHPAAANQLFLAGDSEDLSTSDLFKRLGLALGKPAKLFPVPQWLFEAVLKGLGKADLAQRLCGSLQVDISKARDLLGWHPPVSVDEGLKRTAEWYWQENS